MSSVKEWWPSYDWPNEEILGYPENPDQDSFGYILRVDGIIDVYCWRANTQWYETRNGKWVGPDALIEDGDLYIGKLELR
jgi:hypothetical protein